MKCENCGFESPQERPQCPICQTPLVTLPQTGTNPILAALKDQLFLVICILMSASCLLSLSMDSVPLIHILITVFLWLTYAQSRKDVADAEHLRCVSGAVYAQYVITYVSAGLCLVLGVLFSIIFSALLQDGSLVDSTLSAIADVIEIDASAYAIIESIISASGILVLVGCVLVAAIVTLINYFTLRYIHRFAQSVYQSIQTNVPVFKHTKAAMICLYVLSGCSAISALSSFGDFLPMLSSAVSCATTLIAALLIQKYFQVNE